MGIYVVGSHRSGTSALTGLVAELTGLETSELVVESNPRGQWERRELRLPLDVLLGVNGSTWAQPRREDYQLRAPWPVKAYLDRAFERHCSGPFLWKDPRLCLTMDFWLTMDQDDLKILFIYRDPASAGLSMSERNGYSVELGIAIWERTNRNAMRRLNGREVFCISHESLMAAPADIAGQVADYLEIQVDPSQLANAAARVVSNERPRHNAEVPDEVAALWRQLDGLSGLQRLTPTGTESPQTSSLIRPASKRHVAGRILSMAKAQLVRR